MAGLIHDARNMVSAMDLYCDLLAEPDVLSAHSRHYADELRLVGHACRRLLEKMVVSSAAMARDGVLQAAGSPEMQEQSRRDLRYRSDSPSLQPQSNRIQASQAQSPASQASTGPALNPASGGFWRPARRKALLDGQPVESLAEEVAANQGLLSALVGPGIKLSQSISGGRWPVAMTRDDLTRVLVNLVRNAAEAMPGGGHIQISLREEAGFLTLAVEDNGPGIPEDALEAVFTAGYTARHSPRSEKDSHSEPDTSVWPVRHRGLGLSIVRSIVAAAGGSVRALNRIAGSIAESHSEEKRAEENYADKIAPDVLVANHESNLSSHARSNLAVLGAVILIEFPCYEASISY